MVKPALILLAMLIPAGCATPSHVVATPTTELGTPTHTWVSFDFASELRTVAAPEILSRHILTSLVPHTDTIVGSSHRDSQTPVGCNAPACFSHLRETMSIHRVIAVIIEPYESSWQLTLGIHDLAYGKTLAVVSKRSDGQVSSLQSTLAHLIKSGFTQAQSH